MSSDFRTRQGMVGVNWQYLIVDSLSNVAIIRRNEQVLLSCRQQAAMESTERQLRGRQDYEQRTEAPALIFNV